MHRTDTRHLRGAPSTASTAPTTTSAETTVVGAGDAWAASAPRYLTHGRPAETRPAPPHMRHEYTTYASAMLNRASTCTYTKDPTTVAAARATSPPPPPAEGCDSDSTYAGLSVKRLRYLAFLCVSRLMNECRGGRRRLCADAPQTAKCTLGVCVCVAFLVFGVSLTAQWPHLFPAATEAQLAEQLLPVAEPWAVLVQHAGAAARLNVSRMYEAGQARCARKGTRELCTDRLVVTPTMLPSWTLRVVRRSCAGCLDGHTYDRAVEGVHVREPHAVFATSAAPLGRIGPMLLAMSSVTDDVDVTAELPHWQWLRHVYPNFPAALRSQPPRRRPYLAVMGVPSTDQPARLALRDAQRATWMSYHEVARNENAFEGALLPLYVVAAGKRRRVGAMGAEGVDSARPPVCGDPSPLLPTPEELNVASRVLLEERNGPRTTSFTRHYVSLGEGWRTLQDGASARSPCIGAFTVREPDSTHVSYAAAMGEVLQLSVTPAFVSPAQFVCCVSARLWREALEHRNLIWVDMMTDRRPTTNKALGQDGGWGLPVEVGMTQKTVLWLEYAYHAFPDVPYIMKGDDDTYLKVPQFMSDLRYVQGGLRHRFPPPPPPSASASAAARAAADQREEGYGAVDKLGRPFTAETSECLYWGSLRHHEHTQFNAGMLYLLHRRVAQAVLEPTQNRSRLDVVRLSAEDFTADRSAAYRVLLYDHEDIFMGLRVYDALDRIKALCPNGRLWYVKEWYARFHDLHAGRVHNLTWSTVVAHRCRPADSYFLHHFFQTEYAVSVLRGVGVADVEAAARRGAVEWIAEQLRRGEARQEDGWDTLPVARWSRDLAKTPGFTVAPVDKVAVYEIPYEYWRHGPTTIEDGYRSQPQW
ncbi:phosphoglycan beta 13 galactosyltransferase (SCGR3) [Leptomonas pyrrhocoris]|uniref:Phosphoglycan beta 13 galactosyltransferase (SCGR3) n=1 Tax=Leptomonas pyrrhocoris TaxID=157538 RepID=A0A0M9FRY5_LEPPY|nr:phosphoglycan beta 13 galactosyltransferase (SCGR3) [Leptomonas pyrrhocoris]KPA74850.1 phosphoglycan beta 13 galactosyltransferase (SCGR3) [Leptomonas pyrrhocoris]|eukprot:XP_015653289.1 phosphoglycan beta 13 galactosyltransferase (SCGR3) [Leptomonas pyrrhocoris]